MSNPRVQPQILLKTVREVLMEQATVGTDEYPDQQKNKETLKKFLETLLKDSLHNPGISAEILWMHLWQKIRYAGYSAKKASEEIDRIDKSGIWLRIEDLSSKEWNIDVEEWKKFRNYNKEKYGTNWKKSLKDKTEPSGDFFEKTGRKAYQLMLGVGEFKEIGFVANEGKLLKTITVATELNSFINQNLNSSVLHFFSSRDYDFTLDHFWEIHQKLSKYLGFITALHVMMDLGYKTVKPDRKLVYMLARLGYLDSFSTFVSQAEVTKSYNKSTVIKEVVDIGLKMASDIKDSINPIRELDILLVLS